MDWQNRIVVDPKVLVGKPVIRGTRIAVEFLLDLLANGWTNEQILANYPHLTGDDVQAALHYAKTADGELSDGRTTSAGPVKGRCFRGADGDSC